MKESFTFVSMEQSSTLKFPLIILKLFLGTLFFSALGFAIGNNSLQLSDQFLNFILAWIMTGAFILMITFKLYSRKVSEIKYERELLLTFTLISTAILFSKGEFLYYKINYWIALSLWVLLGLFTIAVESNLSNTKKALFFLSYTWVISSSFISLGQFPFDYSIVPLESLWSIHFLLDVRLIIGLSLLIFSVIYAIIKVKDEKTIIVENLITQQFNNELGQEFSKIINTLWKVFCSPIKFLFFVGIEVIDFYKEVIRNSKHLAIFVGLFVLSIMGLFLSREISPFLHKYLIHSEWSLSFLPLIYSLLLFIPITFCLIGIYYLQSIKYISGKLFRNKGYFSENLVRVINESPNFTMFILFSGWILFAVARLVPELHFISFSIPGILTSSLTAVIVTGIVYSLIAKRNVKSVQDRIKTISRAQSSDYSGKESFTEERKNEVKNVVE